MSYYFASLAALILAIISFILSALAFSSSSVTFGFSGAATGVLVRISISVRGFSFSTFSDLSFFFKPLVISLMSKPRSSLTSSLLGLGAFFSLGSVSQLTLTLGSVIRESRSDLRYGAIPFLPTSLYSLSCTIAHSRRAKNSTFDISTILASIASLSIASIAVVLSSNHLTYRSLSMSYCPIRFSNLPENLAHSKEQKTYGNSVSVKQNLQIPFANSSFI